MLTAPSTSVRRRASAPIAVSTLLLAVVGVLAFWGARSTLVATRAMARVQQVSDRVEAVRLFLVTAAASHRTFLLTLDSASLAASRAAETASVHAARDLAQLLRDEPSQHARTLTLVEQLAKLSTSRADIVRALEKGETAARDALATSDAVDARLQVTASLDSIAQTERDVLLQHGAESDRASLMLFAVLVVALLTAGGLAAWAVVASHSEAESTSASEARHRALSDANPDGIFVQHDGRILFANASAASLLGFAHSQELVGRPFFEFIHPEEREMARRLATSVLELQATLDPQRRRFIRPDGAVLETELRAAPISFEGKAAAEVVVRDLTARLASERALVRSEERYRALLDAMEEGVVLHDASLAVQLWNPAAERILGLTGAQLAGVTSYDPRWRAVDMDGKPLAGDQHAAAIALRTAARATMLMGVDRGEGQRVWLQVCAVPLLNPGSPAPYSVEVTFADITAARDAAERLRESEARYRLLADNSADLVSRRSVDHRFEFASPSHTTVLGWSPEELHGRSAFDLLHPDDAARVRGRLSSIEGSADAGASLATAAVRVRHKAGHYVWLESVATPIVDADGKIAGWQVTARDISARHTLEQQLRQSQKMEAMGRMASGVAHDFNNLLGTIKGSTELLRDWAASPNERHALLADILTATERAAHLTAQLLTFARLRHGAPALVAVAPLLRRAFPLLSRMAGSEVAVELSFGDDIDRAVIDAEPQQIEQVLYNLVVNARDAMSDGGTIRVRCETASCAVALAHKHGVIAPGQYVTIAVDDTGDGMTDEVQARLFDPFVTTQPHGQGTGLGLAMVFELVERAHGAVTVTSVPGQGSSLVIYWPRAILAPDQVIPELETESAPVGALAPGSARPVVRTGESHDAAEPATVVVVDDDEGPRRFVARALEHFGYRVLATASGEEALAVIRRDREKVRALVTDVRMPGMTGIELVSALLDEHIVVPVLFISGQLDVPIPTHWPPNATREFLGKPFSISELALVMQQLVSGGRPMAT